MAITAALTKADPADATTFTANEKTFLTAYQPYVDELGKIKAKYAGTKISYTERVPGYLVQTAGLVLGTPASFSQAVEDGTDPSPGDTATFNADITGHKVKVLLYNGQVTDRQTDKIKALAKDAGVPIVGVTETLPRARRTSRPGSWIRPRPSSPRSADDERRRQPTAFPGAGAGGALAAGDHAVRCPDVVG